MVSSHDGPQRQSLNQETTMTPAESKRNQKLLLYLFEIVAVREVICTVFFTFPLGKQTRDLAGK